MPRTADEVGLEESLLLDLVLRRVLIDGRTSIARLSQGLSLTPPLVEALIVDLRDKKLVEFEGMVGRDYVVVLTSAGQTAAVDRTRACAYAGAAPVPLEQYRTVVARQTPNAALDRATVAEAFSDLVIDPLLIDELGPAMMTGGAIFLYGPPGTGKSSIAERMIRAHDDAVAIPHAVEVDGQIIGIFDPTVHVPLAEQPVDMDRRWVLCRRPCVISGGELTASMLDLGFDQQSGMYRAPLQMKANNGMFVIDDFGRQSMTPAQLLNRWIVPLDRGIDYLSLNTGATFEVPFQAKVVFSTNLPPAALGDEAFFRRLQSKVFIGPVTDDAFDEIVRRVATAKQIAHTDDDVASLRRLARTRGDGDLRPYVPAVICEILQATCRYERTPIAMSHALLERVADVCFTDLTGTGRGRAPRPRERARMPELTVDDAALEAEVAALAHELDRDRWTSF